MKSTILFSILVFTTQVIFGQDLPRGLSEGEISLIESGILTAPRTFPGAITSMRNLDSPRSMAEWEELQAIVITWRSYPQILVEIVRAAREECTVIIVTTDSASVKSTLSNSGIDPGENITFIAAPSNSVWIRDYGANPAYLGDVDSLVLIDWIYNRPRPFDDMIPGHVAQKLGLPLISLTEQPNDLVHTGGNFMSDGHGLGFSSALVLDENDETNIWGMSNHSQEDIEAIMSEFMGITDYGIMDVLPFDGIHHIDMHMKVLDEETILMGEYPDGVADGPQIEANLQYILNQFETIADREFRVVRMPMPPDQFGRYPDGNGFYRTYTNAFFINETILIPTYQEKYDTTALRIWEETMPGYHLVGIDCNDIIPAGGAIHCITKEVGVDNPLWISHTRPDPPLAEASFLIEALIKSRGGIASASLYYSVDGLNYQEISMSGAGDSWGAELPGFPPDTQIRYYFEAESNNGKRLSRPLPAPDGYFEITVQESVVAVKNYNKSTSFLGIPFPNPAKAMTCIPVLSENRLKGIILIRDLYGRLIQVVHAGDIPSGESKFFFDAAKINPGFYFIEYVNGSQLMSRKIMIY